MTNSILVTFPDILLGHNKIEKFRKEVIEQNDRLADIFHNHTPEGGLMARYPKVQYRVRQDYVSGREMAALWGVAEGVKAIKGFLLELENVPFNTDPVQTEIGLCETPKTYRINHVLPFNDANWLAYKEARSIRQRLKIIEQALVGNLLFFCKEMDYQIPNKGLVLEVLDVRELGMKHCPTEGKDDLYLMAFDVIYEANILLPEHLGMGRFKAKGYGWQVETEKLKFSTFQTKRSRKYQKNEVLA